MRDFLKLTAICAVLAAAGFYLLARQLTTVTHPDPRDVDMQFRAVLEHLPEPTPLLRLDATGAIVHQKRTRESIVPSSPVDLIVMGWKDRESGLVETRMPIWLMGAWKPARDYLLRGTGFDPEPWGITVADLRAHEPGLIIDHQTRTGGRLLVWSE